MQSRKFTKNLLASTVAAICLPAMSLGLVSQATAGSVNTANEDVTLSGGTSAGYYYSTNTGSENLDNFVVNEFLIELSAEAKPGGVGFVAGFGNMAQLTVLDGNGDGADTASALRYAAMSYMPMANVTLEAGVLATNVGYELGNSMDNSNITLGAVWNSQPLFYPGARANFDVSGTTVYAEVTNPNAFGAGVIGSAAGVDYALNYYDAKDGNNVIDVVASTSVAGMSVGVNFDYQTLDTAAAGMDDSAMGVGVFIAPKIGMIDLPLRVEYLSDGTSGIYGGMDTGYTVTLTPTLNVSKNGFVRAEVSMVSATNKIFADKDGAAQESKTSAAFQIGYRF